MFWELFARKFTIIFLIYFATAAICIFIIYKLPYVKNRKIESAFKEDNLNQRQILYSIIFIFIAALCDSLFIVFAKTGATQIYLDFHYNNYGWSQILISTIFYVLFYEIYYYLTHRLFHTEFFYNHIHHIHHEVKSPNVLTTFYFHPGEIFFTYFYHILFVSLVPMHPYALIACSLYLQQGNIVGHFGHELFPLKFRKTFSFLNCASGHYLHHQYQNCNYGYTLIIFDKVFKTFKDFNKEK